MEGTPGYITVSATNVNDVQYVEGHKIKYHPNSYFLHDVDRYARFTQGLFTGMTDNSFELDDDGVPYWVISTYQNKRGFNLPEATGAILINATTGEAHKYTLETLPEWVDRIQPEDFIMNQINNKGKYVHGIFNFSNQDKFMTSAGNNIVYNNGRCYLFTGLTSVGADESAIGFIMVDMVTKESHMYQISGATESAAQRSAEGKVQHLGYTASFPIILNVNSQPTYFMTLKDREGLIKQYAMVSVVNYSSVGTGETMAAALRDYEEALKNDKVQAEFQDPAQLKTVTGTVLRIASEVNGGTTEYKLILSEEQSLLFLADSVISDELALTQPEDRVSITYQDNEGGIKTVDSFDNLMFSQE